MFFGVFSPVTECFQSVTTYLQPVTALGTPKNMAAVLPGMMTLQPLQVIVALQSESINIPSQSYIYYELNVSKKIK